jgi:transcription-repair coupling factor (superfamily II helicase)
MYCELLEAAVRKLKKLPPRLSIDVNIDLPGEAFIPDEYLPDQRTKIDLYRRLSRVQSFEDLEEIRVEIKDRFGEPPLPVQRMLALVELKIEAAIWQVESISLDDQDGKPYLVFQYTDEARIRQLVRQQKDRKKRLRVVDDSSAYLPLPAGTEDPDFVLDQVRSVLRAD